MLSLSTEAEGRNQADTYFAQARRCDASIGRFVNALGKSAGMDSCDAIAKGVWGYVSNSIGMSTSTTSYISTDYLVKKSDVLERQIMARYNYIKECVID
ncbi:MAG: hypothetical protein K6B67_05930 [Lachnospiraceae bacterium]|nr:hypothetical protein [Lachnospiraceae bacterium]